MPKRIDIVGKRFGRVVVISDRDENGDLLGTPAARRVLIKCDCGKEKVVNARSIRRGHTRSCGCLQPEIAKKHGMESHPLYNIWKAMNARCYREKTASFPRYGGRGIKVCEEWKNDVIQFIRWAEKNGWEKGLQVDRKDNDGDYTPENCRIVTCKENNNNRISNRKIVIDGELLTIAEASDKYRIKYDKLFQRIFRLGWSPEKAVSSQ